MSRRRAIDVAARYSAAIHARLCATNVNVIRVQYVRQFAVSVDSDSRADSRTPSIVLKMCIQIDFELLITKNLLLENAIQ